MSNIRAFGGQTSDAGAILTAHLSEPPASSPVRTSLVKRSVTSVWRGPDATAAAAAAMACDTSDEGPALSA